jgi:hypothetical protein
MRKLRQPWTNKDIETLRALAKRRKAADIAAELGRSPGSIAVKAHQIGVSLRFHPKDGGLSGALDQHSFTAPPQE